MLSGTIILELLLFVIFVSAAVSEVINSNWTSLNENQINSPEADRTVENLSENHTSTYDEFQMNAVELTSTVSPISTSSFHHKLDYSMDLVDPLKTNVSVATKSSGSKGRKGALTITIIENSTQTAYTVTGSTEKIKSKPTASGIESLNDGDGDVPDKTALIVGVSLGVLFVTIIALISYWRIQDVWAKRQYKRVDFLIDGLYVDT